MPIIANELFRIKLLMVHLPHISFKLHKCIYVLNKYTSVQGCELSIFFCIANLATYIIPFLLQLTLISVENGSSKE